MDKLISQKMIKTLLKKIPQIKWDESNPINYMDVDCKYQGGRKVFSRKLMQERLERELMLMNEKEKESAYPSARDHESTIRTISISPRASQNSTISNSPRYRSSA